MHKIKIVSLVIGLWCLFGIMASGWAKENIRPVKIAILPCNNVVRSFTHFNLLVKYLEQETGLTIRTIFPKTENELERLVKNRGTDFVLLSPFGIEKIKNYLNRTFLLMTLGPDGKDYQIGVVIVREKSRIRNISELRGKSILLGMPSFTSRWIAGKRLFLENGIDIEKDLNYYADGGCCEEISFNVRLGAADAGLICKHFYEYEKKKQSDIVEGLIVIGETDRIPNRIFAAHMETPLDVVAAMEKALMAINLSDPKYKTLIEASEIGGVSKTVLEEYEDYWKDIN